MSFTRYTPGDVVKLSNEMIEFVHDFRSKEEYNAAKALLFLVVDVKNNDDLQEVYLLDDEGSIQEMESYDIQHVAKHNTSVFSI